VARVEKVDVAIVGAGIAGLSAAHEAAARGRAVALLEASDRAGGRMRSTRIDGFLIEHGPHSFLSGAARIWHLIDRTRLRARVLKARPPAHRFVYRKGALRKLPTGPLALLGGDWMSLAGRARAAMEPMIRSRSTEDETVDAFFRRRFGAEVADGLVAPFVSGIYAGDAAQLGAADAFPKLWAMEQAHGSLVQALLKAGAPKNESTAPSRGMFGFDTGMGGLAEAIGAALPRGALRCGSRVVALKPRDGGYRLKLELAEKTSSGRTRTASLDADKVIIALPSGAASGLLAPHCPQASALLDRTELASVALVHLGGPDPTSIAPEGFGALVARGERIETLGVLFPSALFPGRAPPGCWLHTVFIGGAQAPELVDEDDETLVARAVRSHRQLVSPKAGRDLAVSMARVVRCKRAIPQFVPGHRARIGEAREAIDRALPGVVLAGACYGGVSMADAATSGSRVAAELLR